MEVSDEARVKLTYDTAMFFWKTITHIFFRSDQARVCRVIILSHRSPEKFDRAGRTTFRAMDLSYSSARRTIIRYVRELSVNVHFSYLPPAQFLDPLLLGLEVYKETKRRVRFLAAAKSMRRKAVGFFARLMDSSAYH